MINPVYIYLFKSTIASLFFILYYYIFLKDRKLHSFNRFYLLISSVLSLIIPFINFKLIELKSNFIKTSNEIVYFISHDQSSKDVNVASKVDNFIVIYSLISIALVSIFIYNIIKILQLKNKSIIKNIGDYKLIKTDSDLAPFTFFNNLFWNKSYSLEDFECKLILKHELIHIKQKHSIDRLYCQIVSSIFWINPFNWFIQREIISIHEFIADEYAFRENHLDSFAKVMLKVHYHDHFFNPVIGIFNSSIERRIKNINSPGFLKYSNTRKVMSFSTILIVIVSFSISVKANIASSSLHNIQISNLINQEKSIPIRIKKNIKSRTKLTEKSDENFTVYANNKSIKIKRSEIESIELPLVLLDSIPVDLARLNELKVDEIKKVEIKRNVNSKIQFGNTLYPGIIYVTSIDNKNSN